MGNGASISGERSVVLVVDDDAKLRALLKRVLRLGGHEVVEAESAEDAIARLAEMSGRIALVLTDLEMPGMGGEGLVAHIQRERQGLPVLVLTGSCHRVASLSPERQLAKPIGADALLGAIREAIRTATIDVDQ